MDFNAVWCEIKFHRSRFINLLRILPVVALHLGQDGTTKQLKAALTSFPQFIIRHKFEQSGKGERSLYILVNFQAVFFLNLLFF